MREAGAPFDRRWISRFVNRFQEFTATVRGSDVQGVGEWSRTVPFDAPAGTPLNDRFTVKQLIGQVLGRIATRAGIVEDQEVSRAFVALATCDLTRDDWRNVAQNVAEACAAALDARRPALTANPRRHVVSALAFIEQHYADPDLSLSTVARHCSISASYLSTLLTQVSGRGFLDHVHRHRIEASERLLRQTDFLVKEIATMVGYGDPTQLGRHFRQIRGVAPTAFRALPSHDFDRTVAASKNLTKDQKM